MRTGRRPYQPLEERVLRFKKVPGVGWIFFAGICHPTAGNWGGEKLPLPGTQGESSLGARAPSEDLSS